METDATAAERRMIMSKDYPCVYWNDGKCKKFSDDSVTSWCVWSPCYSQTPSNADRIRSMTDEKMAKFIQNMVDGSNSHNVACYGCINYGTHHSNPANKGTYLYECEGCESEGIGLDVLMWLQQPAEEADNEIVGERKDGDD